MPSTAAGVTLIISIHAPREGSDRNDQDENQESDISIHAPREGSDWGVTGTSVFDAEFQSTLPVRGAT